MDLEAAAEAEDSGAVVAAAAAVVEVAAVGVLEAEVCSVLVVTNRLSFD